MTPTLRSISSSLLKRGKQHQERLSALTTAVYEAWENSGQ